MSPSELKPFSRFQFAIEQPSMLIYLLRMTLRHPSLPREILKPSEKRSRESDPYFSQIQAYHIRFEIQRARKRFNKLWTGLASPIGIKLWEEIMQKESKALKCCYWRSLLYTFCRAVKPRVIVETGVAHGGSTAHILQSLEDNGQGFLHSIDLPEATETDFRLGSFGSGHAVPQHLRKRWGLLLGSSEELLPGLLERLGEIDLFIHDSEHTYKNMMFEYEAAWKHIRPGGFLISDDVHRTGAFKDFCQAKGVEGLEVGGEGICIKK